MRIESLRQLAHKQYAPEGPNQWPHIQRVLQTARKIARQQLGRRLSPAEETAVLFHDVDKANAGIQRHGEHAADWVRGHLKRLPEQDRNYVMGLIKFHDDDPPRTRHPAYNTGVPASVFNQSLQLLQAADATPPDLGAYIRKCFDFRKRKLLDFDREGFDDTLMQDVIQRVKTLVGIRAAETNPLYARYYKDRLPAYVEKAKKLTLQEAYSLMEENRKKPLN